MADKTIDIKIVASDNGVIDQMILKKGELEKPIKIQADSGKMEELIGLINKIQQQLEKPIKMNVDVDTKKVENALDTVKTSIDSVIKKRVNDKGVEEVLGLSVSGMNGVTKSLASVRDTLSEIRNNVAKPARQKSVIQEELDNANKQVEKLEKLQKKIASIGGKAYASLAYENDAGTYMRPDELQPKKIQDLLKERETYYTQLMKSVSQYMKEGGTLSDLQNIEVKTPRFLVEYEEGKTDLDAYEAKVTDVVQQITNVWKEANAKLIAEAEAQKQEVNKKQLKIIPDFTSDTESIYSIKDKLSAEMRSFEEFDTLGNIEKAIKNITGSLTSLSQAFETGGETNFAASIQGMIDGFSSLSTVLTNLEQSFSNISFLKTLQEGGKPIDITINASEAVNQIDDLTKKIQDLVDTPKEIVLSMSSVEGLSDQIDNINNLIEKVSTKINNLKNTRTMASVEKDLNQAQSNYDKLKNLQAVATGTSNKKYSANNILQTTMKSTQTTDEIEKMKSYVETVTSFVKHGGDIKEAFTINLGNKKSGITEYTVSIESLINKIKSLNKADLKSTLNSYDEMVAKLDKNPTVSFEKQLERRKADVEQYSKELDSSLRIDESQKSFTQIAESAAKLTTVLTQLHESGNLENLFNFGGAQEQIQSLVNMLRNLYNTVRTLGDLINHLDIGIKPSGNYEELQKMRANIQTQAQTNTTTTVPVQVKVDAEQAKQNIETVKNELTSIKDEEVKVNVTVPNKNSVVNKQQTEQDIQSGVSESLLSLDDRVNQVVNNVSSSVDSIKTKIIEISDAINGVGTAFSTLDTSISQSVGNANNLSEAISKINQTQNTASTYTASPIENVETLTTAYQTMNKAISEAADAQTRLSTLSVTKEGANGEKIEISYAQQLQQLQDESEKIAESIGKLKSSVESIQNAFANIDLSQFSSNVKTIFTSLSQIPDDVKTKLNEIGETLEQFKVKSQGLDGQNFSTMFKSFNIPEGVPDKILDLAAAFETLRDALSSFISGESNLTGIIDSLNQLLQDSQNLKALSDVLKASESKISNVREATKTQEQKDYEAETVRLQSESYKELTNAVNDYVKARESIAKGQNTAFNTSMLSSYAQKMEDIKTQIEGNARIFDTNKMAASLAPLDGLEERLEQLKQATENQNITNNVNKILNSADTWLRANEEKVSGNADLQDYFTNVKNKAEEVRQAIQNIGSDTSNIDVSGLETLSNELDKVLRVSSEKVRTGLRQNQRDSAISDNALFKSTNFSSTYSSALRYYTNNARYANDTKEDGELTNYAKSLQALNSQLEHTRDLMQGIDTKNLKEGDIEKITNEVTNLTTALQGAQDATPASELKRETTLKYFEQWLSKNGVAISKYGSEVDYLREQVANADSEISLRNAATEIQKFEARLIAAGDVGKTFGEKLQATFSGLGRYLMTYVSFYRIIGTLKEGINIVKEFDSAMKSIKMVSSETNNVYETMQKESFDIAESIGSNALSIQQSMGTWLRLGKSMQESQEAAKASSWLVNVSEFDNIDEASTALVSMKQAYDDLSYEDILDKLNAVGDSFSSSTDALASGLQNAAGVLKIQGNDIDQSLALLTAGNVVARNYRNIIYSTCLIALVA